MIDARGLSCPEPVILTKNAIEKQSGDFIIEVLINTDTSKENIERFCNSKSLNIKSEKLNESDIKLTVSRGFNCKLDSKLSDLNFKKTILIKDDKLGEGEFGEKLLIGFLKTFLDTDSKPKKLFFINRAIFLTTKNEDSINILLELEKMGVEIYSCSLCLEHFGLELKVGRVGNALETVNSLLDDNFIAL